jgi:hypothetical protein
LEAQIKANAGIQPNAPWNHWIWCLTKILDDAQLPTGVRKDGDATGKTSPFVVLVSKLQSFIPHQFRRSAQLNALAEAISEARRSDEIEAAARDWPALPATESELQALRELQPLANDMIRDTEKEVWTDALSEEPLDDDGE